MDRAGMEGKVRKKRPAKMEVPTIKGIAAEVGLKALFCRKGGSGSDFNSQLGIFTGPTLSPKNGRNVWCQSNIFRND
jgi:hypothetical protein